MKRFLATLALCALILSTTVTVSFAQDVTPEPSPTGEATEIASAGDTVTTVTVTTEPVTSNTVQSFLGVISGMLIDLVVPVLAVIAIGIFYRAFQFIHSKIGVEQETLIRQLVNMAVQAAEQVGLTDELIQSGADKKDFAIKTLQEALRARGLGVFADYIPELEARIEAAINQEVQKPYPPLPTPEPVQVIAVDPKSLSSSSDESVNRGRY